MPCNKVYYRRGGIPEVAGLSDLCAGPLDRVRLTGNPAPSSTQLNAERNMAEDIVKAPDSRITAKESDLLTCVLCFLSDDSLGYSRQDVNAIGREAGLTARAVDALVAWIRHKGDMFSIMAEEDIPADALTSLFASPAMLRILDELSRRDASVPPPVATKDELLAVWTAASRSPGLPLTFQKEARQEIAKLSGLYPDDKGKGGGQTNIQINMVNPYAAPEVKHAEAD